MDRKIILCRCEDVTAADVAHAVATGFDGVEEVKRFTGFGTGPCQGKDCIRLVVEHLSQLTGRGPSGLQPFTSRPPLAPVPLAALAVEPNEPLAAPAPVSVPHRSASAAPRVAAAAVKHATGPPAAEYDVAIVGGGIMGLAIAYELAERGVTKVVVLEGKHLAWGASGRNGGGVRQQWSSALNIELMQESVSLCKSFAKRLKTNIWMRQGGYLFLATTAERLKRMEDNVALQNRHGVGTEMIGISEAQKIVPELNPEGLVGACYNSTDGIVFPWPFLWGYAAAAEKRGVAIHTFCPVTNIEPGPNGGFRLYTHKGAFSAARVVNAAGAWSAQVARMVAIDLPTWPVRHEILSTEALKPFLKPMVSVMDSGLYASQSLRGEIVGGITLPAAHDTSQGISMTSSAAFLKAMGTELTRRLPILGSVKVVRQWAGPYDHSSDGSPLVGESPDVPNFFLCCGFVGHGFMMAPVVAKHYAAVLCGEEPHPLFKAWRPNRFAEGDVIKEDWNIG